jgi:hypothetical protein
MAAIVVAGVAMMGKFITAGVNKNNRDWTG